MRNLKFAIYAVFSPRLYWKQPLFITSSLLSNRPMGILGTLGTRKDSWIWVRKQCDKKSYVETIHGGNHGKSFGETRNILIDHRGFCRLENSGETTVVYRHVSEKEHVNCWANLQFLDKLTIHVCIHTYMIRCGSVLNMGTPNDWVFPLIRSNNSDNLGYPKKLGHLRVGYRLQGEGFTVLVFLLRY